MTTGIMGLAPEEFWTDPHRTRDGAVRAAADSAWRGYAIDAPPVVDLGLRDTLPVLGLRNLTAAESAAADLRTHAVVVATRLESNETFAARAFPWKPVAPPANPKPRRPPSPTVTVTDAFAFELRERIPALPWAPGTYRVTLLVLDRATDPVDVRLAVRAGPDLHEIPVRDAASPPPGEGAALPSYERGDGSPAVPASPGISMVGERVVLDAPGARCELRGAFRLPVTRFDVPAWAEEAPTTRLRAIDPDALAAPAAPGAQCFVPITLVATGPTLIEPWVHTLVAPSRDHPRALGADVTGWFALDLFALPGFPREHGTYRLWAFSAGLAAGPEPVALVAEARLAPA